MSVVKAIRTVVSYTAIAVGVTVGGVAIGAMVVAPMVAPATAPSKSVSVPRLAKDLLAAIPDFDRIPSRVWLFVAGAAAVVLLALIGWKLGARIRARLSARAASVSPAALELASIAASALPSKLVGGKNRTPRA
ncbi:MAG: hypothetical protein ABJB66_19205, partial [Gemmatimonadaceae bacterium]